MRSSIMHKLWKLSVFIPFLVLSACKSSSQARAGGETGVAAQEEPSSQVPLVQSWTRDQAANGPERFRLVVSLISIGEGTDPEGMRLIERYVEDFGKLSGKSLSYVLIPWGREGEVDCCFALNELTPALQAQFIEGLKERIKGRNLLQINENARNRFR